MSNFSNTRKEMSYLDPPPEVSTRFRKSANVNGRSSRDRTLIKHLHASLYPFHSEPVATSFPYQTHVRVEKAYARGTFITSTNDGWGFIRATPVAASSGLTGAINWSPGAATAHDAFTGGTNVSNLNGSFASTAFGVDTLNSRIISCGLRVRNITTLLNRGGTLFALRSANDQGLGTAVSFNTLISDLDASGNSWRASTSGDKWEYLSWAPRTDDQYSSFSTSFTGYTVQGTTMTAPPIAFVASAPGFAIQQTYEWEYVVHYEILDGVGTLMQGHVRGTPHSDLPECLQAVYALSRKPEVAGNEASNRIAGYIADAVAAGNDLETIVSTGVDLVKQTAAVLPAIYSATKAIGSWL